MTDKNSLSRRNSLKVLGGTALTTALAGCSSVIGGKNEFEKEIDTIKENVDEYDKNIEGAIEDGYTDFLGPGIPGMGWHIINMQYVQTALEGDGFSIEEPPALVYSPDKDLAGVEYFGPSRLVSQSPDLLSDGTSDDPETWTLNKGSTNPLSAPDYMEKNEFEEIPLNERLTQANWAEILPQDDSISLGDELTTTWAGHDQEETRVVDYLLSNPELRTLHIWTHIDNPDGMFNPTNPDFAQDLNEIDGHTHQ